MGFNGAEFDEMEASKYVFYDLQWMKIKRSIPAKRRNGDEGVGMEGLGLISQVFESDHSERHAHISTKKLTNQPNCVNELEFFFNRNLGDLFSK